MKVRYGNAHYDVRLCAGTTNVYIPTSWDESPFRKHILLVSSLWPRTTFLVSSIDKTVDGHPRNDDPHSRYYGPSHMTKEAIDIAPIASLGNPYGENRNPRLADQLPILMALAARASEIDFLFAIEGNHFHLDKRGPSLIAAVPTYAMAYDNDRKDLLSGRPRWRVIWNSTLGAFMPISNPDFQALLR